MKKALIIISFVLLSINLAIGQGPIENTITAFKSSRFNKAERYANQIENKAIRELFLYLINYKINGFYEDIKLEDYTEPLNEKELIVYKNLIGDFYMTEEEAQLNKKIYKNYKEAYSLAIKVNDSSLINQSLRKLVNYLNYRNRADTTIVKKYTDDLLRYQQDETDLFWYHYYSIGYEFIVVEKKIKEKLINMDDIILYHEKEINKHFSKLFQYSSTNDFLKALSFQLLMIYQGFFLKDYTKSNETGLKAKDIYKEFPFFYARFKEQGVQNNIANNYKKLGFHKEAISFFKEDLKRNKERILKMNSYRLISESYESLKQLDSAFYYLKLMHNEKELLNEKKYAKEISKIDAKYNLDQKSKEYALLERKYKKLERETTTLRSLIPILGIITIILILIFYLYKRYKKKSDVLEEEQSETIKKLDELKQIVIKNHIVLKDKTKIYVSELMYIKSDDHYLRIYTQGGKDHFVRGKLSQIKEELPPNFIQCHRSYIVNSNFIKQVNSIHIILINKEEIPLSRSYKDKF